MRFGLIVVINNVEDLIFVSNGENKLVCEGTELDYLFKYNSYYINLLKNNYDSVIKNLNSSFTVKVKYCYNHNNEKTDLDSEFTSLKTMAE